MDGNRNESIEARGKEDQNPSDLWPVHWEWMWQHQKGCTVWDQFSLKMVFITFWPNVIVTNVITSWDVFTFSQQNFSKYNQIPSNLEEINISVKKTWNILKESLTNYSQISLKSLKIFQWNFVRKHKNLFPLKCSCLCTNTFSKFPWKCQKIWSLSPDKSL